MLTPARQQKNSSRTNEASHIFPIDGIWFDVIASPCGVPSGHQPSQEAER